MRVIFSFISAASLIALGLCGSNASSAVTPGVSLAELQQQAYRNQLAELSKRTSGCTLETMTVRKEWQGRPFSGLPALRYWGYYRSNSYAHRGSLTAEQRISYTNAVLCLQSRPAITPISAAPGVRSRFDDFAAAHINQTLIIHFTVSLFFQCHCAELIKSRSPYSLPGIDILFIPMSRRSSMNAATVVFSHTGTGQHMLPTLSRTRFSMAPKPPSAAMGPISLTTYLISLYRLSIGP